MKELISLVMAIIVVVTSVIDGDTFRALLGNELVKVRLYGVNAPERGMKCYGEAKEALERSLKSTATLVPLGKGIYGRVIAIVNNGTRDVGQMLIEKGLALPYPYPPPNRAYFGIASKYIERVLELWKGACWLNGTFGGVRLISMIYNPPGPDAGREKVVLYSNSTVTVTLVNKRWRSYTAVVTPGTNTITITYPYGFLGNKGDVVLVEVSGRLAALGAYAPWARITTIKNFGSR